ncbi:hypothetical protein JKP88DRAFT_247958 [Tribonema minus]|uniref:CCHC-type domain-containing protein n=1 Tax=Tribonema minus TaxID=303371 RepID=A0A836CC27_9STRA|nr:hypothetical protein JKP88DRAFT_247958 [Tribonema minus]
MSSSEPEQDESYSVVNARFFLVVSNSIDPRAMGPTRIVMQFTDSQDGRGAFKALESAHKPNTTFNKLQLHAKLADPVRENNEDITAYSLRLVNLRDELRIKEGNKQVWPDMQFGGAAEGTTRRQHLRHDNRDHQHYRGHHPRASDAAAATAFKGTCYNCGATGHKSRDCSRRKGGATRHGSNDGQHSRQAHRQANGGNRSDGKNRGDPKQQAGAGSNGKYCPVHPMAKHDAGECKGLRTSCTTGIIPGCFLQNPGCPTKNSALVLKQHPHLATALAAVATNQEAKSAAAGEQDLPIIRPFGLVTTAPAAVELKPAALAAAADDMPIDMVLDSGAPHHYFDPFELNWSFGVALTDIKPYNHKVNTGGGSRSAVCMGTVHLRLTAADGSLVPLAIANSINVPLLGHHLLSVNANLKAATAAAAAAAGPSHPGYDGDDFDVVSMLEADSDDDEIIPSSATAPTPLAAAAHPGIDAAVGAVTTDPAAGDGDTARNGGSAAATGAVMAARTAPSIPRWKQPKQPSTHAMGTRTRATSQPPPAVNVATAAVAAIAAAPPIYPSHTCAATAMLAQAYPTITGVRVADDGGIPVPGEREVVLHLATALYRVPRQASDAVRAQPTSWNVVGDAVAAAAGAGGHGQAIVAGGRTPAVQAAGGAHAQPSAADGAGAAVTGPAHVGGAAAALATGAGAAAGGGAGAAAGADAAGAAAAAAAPAAPRARPRRCRARAPAEGVLDRGDAPRPRRPAYTTTRDPRIGNVLDAVDCDVGELIKWVERASGTKFYHLLAPLAFAQQSAAGNHARHRLGPATRLQHVAAGTFGPLLWSVLAAARAPCTRAADASRLPEPDKDWDPAHMAILTDGAELSSLRNGVSRVARRLEQQDSQCPANEATYEVLVRKHPAPHQRVGVVDAAHDEVRAVLAAARVRCELYAPGLAPPPDNHATAILAEVAPAAGAGDPVQPLALTPSMVVEALYAASAGSAAGLDGMRYEFLWAAMGTSAQAAAADDAERADVIDGTPAPPLAERLAALFNNLIATPEAMPDSALRLWRAASQC